MGTLCPILAPHGMHPSLIIGTAIRHIIILRGLELGEPVPQGTRLSPNIAPGALGFVIPEYYKGTALPFDDSI